MAGLQKERDPLLSGKYFATLHQEGQKIHTEGYSSVLSTVLGSPGQPSRPASSVLLQHAENKF